MLPRAPKVTVSIVSHKGDHLLACISALLSRPSGFEKHEVEIILSDNKLSPHILRDAQLMLDRHGEFRLLHSSVNLGFQEPNRRALALARGKYFLMLNDDLIVEDDNWAIKLVRPFWRDVNCALTGPHSGRCVIGKDFVGRRVRPKDRFDYIQGSCLMGETRLLQKVGLFDPALYFAYGEDSDLALRMKKEGLSLATVNLKTRHFGGATTGQVPGMAGVIERNHAYLRTKWATWLSTGKF